jgi:hypothetical protein
MEQAIQEIAGNEALLEMLDTDAAMEMLNWGKNMIGSVVSTTDGLDDIAADLALLPRFKAVRQTIRSVGNWAAGKYSDPAARVSLRDKLLGYFHTIFGETAKLPGAEQLDAVLNEVDNQRNTPLQLILKLKALLQESK